MVHGFISYQMLCIIIIRSKINQMPLTTQHIRNSTIDPVRTYLCTIDETSTNITHISFWPGDFRLNKRPTLNSGINVAPGTLGKNIKHSP